MRSGAVIQGFPLILSLSKDSLEAGRQPRARRASRPDPARGRGPRRSAPRRRQPKPARRSVLARRCRSRRRRRTRLARCGRSRGASEVSVSRVSRSRLFTPTMRAPAARARSTSTAEWVSTSASKPSPCVAASRSASNGLLEGAHDQQHGVRAKRARFVDLVDVDDEVLAQHGQAAGFSGFGQIGVLTSKVAIIG